MSAMDDEIGQPAIAQYRINGIPNSMYYVPEFITASEEEYILNHISPNKWVSLSHRRLQTLPARLTASNTLVSSTGLPDWLTKPILDRFEKLGIFNGAPHGQANHCLINEYLPGQGIMPHEDGAAYHPIVATVSLSGTLVLDVYGKSAANNVDNGDQAREPAQRQRWRIVQEPRSLLVTTGAAYTDTLHGIAEIEQDVDLNGATVANWDLLGSGKQAIIDAGEKNERSTRISLTFRDVLKVSKVGSTIFGKPKG